MDDLERIRNLEFENAKLREDKEILLNVISRMRHTLDRLVSRFIVEEHR